jgi:hypothetical protein
MIQNVLLAMLHPYNYYKEYTSLQMNLDVFNVISSTTTVQDPIKFHLEN